MKTLFFSIVLVTLFACRPENMINNKLNGDWSLVTVDGQAIDPNTSETLHFSKKGSGGDVIITRINNGQTVTLTGTYDLLKTQFLTIAIPNGSTTGYPYDIYRYDLKKYSKTELTMAFEYDAKTYYYKKK